METITLQLPGLEEIQNQIRELGKKVEEIQKQDLSSKWLSNLEACEFLGVTTRTLQNYRDNGTISYSKIGSKIYYKLCDLENHLADHYTCAFSKGRRAE